MTKTVVITGAGSGIGRATALAFAARANPVVLAGRRAEPLEETRALLPDPALGLVVPTDVTDEAAVARLFEAAVDTFGRVDVLFNNAGIFGAGGSVDLVDVAVWRALVEVNLTGSFLCAAEAFRVMKAQAPQGGRIINNGSISAHHPRPFSAAYTATKHAITGLTKSISLDGRPFGITCGQIDIGNAATGMTGQMAVGMPQADGSIKPESRMDVARAAEAVVFMACQPAEADISFLTIAATTMPFIGRG
ncbi:MAG: SDR family oxidoreductase [Zavarzinia sp.]|nr:SDR family oxidoreductase [Zavarzinia sp.]